MKYPKIQCQSIKMNKFPRKVGSRTKTSLHIKLIHRLMNHKFTRSQRQYITIYGAKSKTLILFSGQNQALNLRMKHIRSLNLHTNRSVFSNPWMSKLNTRRNSEKSLILIGTHSQMCLLSTTTCTLTWEQKGPKRFFKETSKTYKETILLSTIQNRSFKVKIKLALQI